MPDLKLSDDERRIYIEALEGEGFQVTKNDPRPEAEVTKLDLAKPGSIIRLGIVSDTHLCSKFQQLTALKDFYRKCDERKVDVFIHGGDLVDGSHKMHRDHIFGNFAHGFDAQLDYAISEYPKSSRRGVRTIVIQGNHDYSFASDGGGDIVQHLSRAREDIQYAGYHSAFIEVGPLRIFLVHGARGGLSYAKSYKPQRLAEALDVDERAKTQLMLIGHYHTGNFIPRYQGMDIFLLPSFQSQTPFLRTLGLQPVVGGIILEVEFGIGKRVLRHEWVTYDPIDGDYPGAPQTK